MTFKSVARDVYEICKLPENVPISEIESLDLPEIPTYVPIDGSMLLDKARQLSLALGEPENALSDHIQSRLDDINSKLERIYSELNSCSDSVRAVTLRTMKVAQETRDCILLLNETLTNFRDSIEDSVLVRRRKYGS